MRNKEHIFKPYSFNRRTRLFFAAIMINFKKAYNLKIISLIVAGLFLLNSTAYGIDLSEKSHLRNHLLSNSKKGEERLKDSLVEVLDLKGLTSENVSLRIYQELKSNGKLSDKNSIEQAIQRLNFEKRKELFLMLDKELVKKGFMGIAVQKRYNFLQLLASEENIKLISFSSYIEEDLKEKIYKMKDRDDFSSISKYILLNAIRRGEDLFAEFEELPGMPKVLVISSFENKELKPGSFLAPPLGAYHLKSYLRFFGVKVDVYDPNMVGSMEQVKAELRKLIIESNYQIIGSSIYQPTLAFDREIAEYLHSQFPDSLFIAGGEAADFNYFRLINESIYDATILGFGEYQLLDIAVNYTNKANFFNQIQKIKNLRLRHPAPGKAVILTELLSEYSKEDYEVLAMSFNFKDIPFEDYWHIMEEHLEGTSLAKMKDLDAIYAVRLITSSHCPMGCSFCTSTNFLDHSVGRRKQRLRILSAEQIVKQLELIGIHHPNARTIFFNDDDFLIERQRLIELCDLIEKRFGNSRFKFIVLGRVDKIDMELLSRMKRVGFIQFNYGVEHFSDKVLEHMNKKVKAKEIVEGIRMTLKAGIMPLMNLILFYPTATMEDVKITIDQSVELVREGAGLSYWPMVEAFEGATITEKARKGEFKIEHFEDWKNDFIVPQDSKTKDICIAALRKKSQVVKEIKEKYSLAPEEKLPHVVDVLCFFLSVYQEAGYDCGLILKAIDEQMNNSVFHEILNSIESNKIFSIDSLLDGLPASDRKALFEKLAAYEQKTPKVLWKIRTAAYAHAVAQSLGQEQVSQAALDRTFEYILKLIKDVIGAMANPKQVTIADYNLSIPKVLQKGDWLLVESPIRVEIESQISDLLIISLMDPEISHVLNLSVDIDGLLPVRVAIRRTDKLTIQILSKDLNLYKEIQSLDQLFGDWSDLNKHPLRLMEGAIVASGVIPLSSKDQREFSLQDILRKLGGGIEIVTEVQGIPQHSGLGVSSVLGGSLICALRRFSSQEKMTQTIHEEEVEAAVAQGIFLEQLIGVGGGYQDFFGMVPGFKEIRAKKAENALREIAPGDIVPTFQSLNLKESTLHNLKAGMVLWDQGAHIPVADSLRIIVMNFLLGRDQKARENWKGLYSGMTEAIRVADIKRIGELQNKSFENRRDITGKAWPESLDLYVRRIEEELTKHFGVDYYGSNNSGARPGAARVAYINPGRRAEFEHVALRIAKDIQKEILVQADGKGWSNVNFEEPKVYNFEVNDSGLKVSIHPSLSWIDITQFPGAKLSSDVVSESSLIRSQI